MRRLLWGALAALSALLVLAGSFYAARQAALRNAQTIGQQRLGLYATTIRTALDKYSYLPNAMATDGAILHMLTHPGQADIAAINTRLEAINDVAESAGLYVMDATGMTLVASNWQESFTYVGNDYHIRPYFQEARDQGTGHFFAVGLTTRRPGYFLASAVRNDKGGFIGAVVVKIELEELEKQWSLANERVLVSDANGVTILTSNPHWKYTVDHTLTDRQVALLKETLPYGDEPIRPWKAKLLQSLGEHVQLIALDGKHYLMLDQKVPGEDWTLRYLIDWDASMSDVRGTTFMAGLAWAATVLLLMYLHQRRSAARSRAEAQAAVADALRRAHDDLERTVARRTADLKAEILERQRTEQDLRATQDELVHAGKMAALGQMSAALAHEINQPLAAIQTFVASSRIFTERGERAQVAANLAMIDDLTGRMAGLTRHLKAFARKDPLTVMAMDPAQPLERALIMLDAPLRQNAVIVTKDFAPVTAAGDPTRLEQVSVNLLRNAIDAMADSAERRLTLSVRAEDGHCLIRVEDSGHGLAPSVAQHLFEPFFTTKQVGEGLGLGLSLSYAIIRSMGGAIHGEPGANGGAVFTITLPLWTEDIGQWE